MKSLTTPVLIAAFFVACGGPSSPTGPPVILVIIPTPTPTPAPTPREVWGAAGAGPREFIQQGGGYDLVKIALTYSGPSAHVVVSTTDAPQIVLIDVILSTLGVGTLFEGTYPNIAGPNSLGNKFTIKDASGQVAWHFTGHKLL